MENHHSVAPEIAGAHVVGSGRRSGQGRQHEHALSSTEKCRLQDQSNRDRLRAFKDMNKPRLWPTSSRTNRDEDRRNLGDANAVGSVSHHSLLSDNCGFLKSRRHAE